MKRLLLFALTAGLLIPNVAKAERDEVRHMCASWQVGDLKGKQALRKLGLSVPREEIEATRKFVRYCKIYLGNPTDY